MQQTRESCNNEYGRWELRTTVISSILSSVFISLSPTAFAKYVLILDCIIEILFLVQILMLLINLVIFFAKLLSSISTVLYYKVSMACVINSVYKVHL